LIKNQDETDIRGTFTKLKEIYACNIQFKNKMKITKDKYEHFRKMELEKHPLNQWMKYTATYADVFSSALKELYTKIDEITPIITEMTKSMQKENKRLMLGKISEWAKTNIISEWILWKKC
jgi:hypothetical protein